MSNTTYTGPRNTGHTFVGPRTLRGYEVHLDAMESTPKQILCVSEYGQIMSMYQKEALQLLPGRELWDEDSNLGTLVGELTTENRRSPTPKRPYEIREGEIATILDLNKNPLGEFRVKKIIQRYYIGY